jgi:hypothetical protein
MARKEMVVITDDLDGSEGAVTVGFAYRGVAYTIDLSSENVETFDQEMQPYLDAATRVGRYTVTNKARAQMPARGDAAQIREWAVSQGYEVSKRGRISAELREAYDAAAR